MESVTGCGIRHGGTARFIRPSIHAFPFFAANPLFESDSDFDSNTRRRTRHANGLGRCERESDSESDSRLEEEKTRICPWLEWADALVLEDSFFIRMGLYQRPLPPGPAGNNFKEFWPTCFRNSLTVCTLLPLVWSEKFQYLSPILHTFQNGSI